MKYILFLFWMSLSAVMLLLVFPAIIAGEYGWFELGERMYNKLK